MSEQKVAETETKRAVEEVMKEEPKPAEKPSFAEHFERVSKQEKYLSDERRKLQDQKRVFEEQSELARQYSSLKEKSPFEILEHFGVTYEKLLEADKQRNQAVDPVAKKALEEVERLKSDLTKRDEESDRAKLAKAELELKQSIKSEIQAGEFDLIEKLGMEAAVQDYMEETFELSGKIPSVSEACQVINESLVAKILAVKGSKWLAEKEPALSETTLQKETPVLDQPSKKSISNKMVQSSEANKAVVSGDELMQEAIRIMQRSGRK